MLILASDLRSNSRILPYIKVQTLLQSLIMKNIICFLFIALSTNLFAQKPAVVSIQTNAQCGDCKERIETTLNQTKGVVYAELNLETKIVEVKYKPGKTDVAALQKALTAIGYDADDQKADATAQKSLPLCCQPGGH
jgi:copper chaperone CopZ